MATISSAGTGPSTDAATWVGGVVPVAGDDVVIVAGHTVTVAGTHVWGSDTGDAVTVHGTLAASRSTDTSLTLRGNLVVESGGVFDYGRDGDPCVHNHELVLNDSASPAYAKYVLTITAEGELYAYGVASRTYKTALALPATAGDDTFTVTDATGWAVGDTVVVAPAGQYYRKPARHTVVSVTGNLVQIDSPLSHGRPAGITVGNLTRNIRIRAADLDLATRAYIYVTATTPAASRSLRHVEFAAMDRGSGVLINCTSPNTGAVGEVADISLHGIRDQLLSVIALPQRVQFGIMSWSFGARNFDLSSGAKVGLRDSVLFRGSFLVYSFNNGFDSSAFDNCEFFGGSFSLWGRPANAPIYRGCRFGCLQTAVRIDAGMPAQFVDCVVGTAEQPIQSLVSVIAGAGTETRWTDCQIAAPVPSLSGVLESARVVIANRDGDPLQQEVHSPVGTISRDNATYRSGAPAVRLEPVLLGSSLTFALDVFAVNDAPVAVSGYLRKSSDYDGPLPQVTLSGLGITPDTAVMADVSDEWWQFAVAGTQSTGTDGMLTLTFEVSGTAGSVWVDDVSAPPAAAISTGEFAFWQSGEPVAAVVANYVSPLDNWQVMADQLTLPGSIAVTLLDATAGGGGPTAAEIAAAVRVALADELGRIDADVSSRAGQAELAALPQQIWDEPL